MTPKEALLERSRVLESQIEDRNRAAEEANRKDGIELAGIYRKLASLHEPTPAVIPPPVAVAAMPLVIAEPSEPKVEPVELGVQDCVLALMHRYGGQKFDVSYAASAIYPKDPKDSKGKARSYKKVYATFDAMVKAGKAKKAPGECCWQPLKPRDPRPIRLPNGEILEATV